MAKYAISREGIESLHALSGQLNSATSAIDDASQTLYASIQSIEEGLGVYEKDIYVLLKQIISTNQRGKESVEQLTRFSIPKQVLQIEKLLILCGDDSGEDPDEPPQKKLVLRRHR